MEEADNFKIKWIEVKPGASLSLQMHHHRSEHWIVVSGTAKVVNGEREFLVVSHELREPFVVGHSIEPFDIRIVLRLSGLDVCQLDLFGVGSLDDCTDSDSPVRYHTGC